MARQISLCFLSLVFVSSAFGIQSEHLPDGDCTEIIDYSYYSVCYEPEHRQSSWVKYTLTQKFIEGKQKRTNDYRKDPMLADPVLGSDYRGSGFDRGHLLPAADMKLNYQAMTETFYMTNMSPQRSGFNRRIWASIERRMRRLVGKYGKAHVITAGVLEKNLPAIDSGVTIPRWFYKVAYFPEAQITKAFLIENQRHSSVTYSDFLVSVDEVEELTGFDFFADLPDELETKVEALIFRQ